MIDVAIITNDIFFHKSTNKQFSSVKISQSKRHILQADLFVYVCEKPFLLYL